MYNYREAKNELIKSNTKQLERGINILQEFDYSILEKVKYKELRLSTCIFGLNLTGVIDAIVEAKGKYYILDYKTGNNIDNNVYEIQATIYYILARTNGIPVEDTIVYYFIEKNKKIAYKPNYYTLFLLINEILSEKNFDKLDHVAGICKYCKLYSDCWKK